jgi:hypothetical protein
MQELKEILQEMYTVGTEEETDAVGTVVLEQETDDDIVGMVLLEQEETDDTVGTVVLLDEETDTDDIVVLKDDVDTGGMATKRLVVEIILQILLENVASSR